MDKNDQVSQAYLMSDFVVDATFVSSGPFLS